MNPLEGTTGKRDSVVDLDVSTRSVVPYLSGSLFYLFKTSGGDPKVYERVLLLFILK